MCFIGKRCAYSRQRVAVLTLEPFGEPASTTDPSGLTAQTAAVGQATGAVAREGWSAVSSAQQALAAVPTALSNLASPAPAAAVSPFDILGVVDFSVGIFGVTADTLLATYALQYDVAGYHVGVHTDDIISGWAGIENWPGSAPTPPTEFPVITNLGSSVSASLGEAGSVGALSVPPGWTTAAPALRLAALASASVGAAAEASADGAGAVFSQMALAGMAGRAMAGTVGTGGSGGAPTRERAGVAKRSTDGAAATEVAAEPSTPPPVLSGGPITSIAAELRELASLRDAGILTEEEFTEQKQRLLPH